MEIISGYFEIYDLTMAINFSFNTGPVERALKTLGVDYSPSRELIKFKGMLNSNMNWSMKIFTTCMNELGVIAPILFPLRQKMQDGTIVTIEESLDISDDSLKILRERFIAVLASRRLNVSYDELSRMLEVDPSLVSKRIGEIAGISKDTVWFINQLLFFPKTAIDFLETNTLRLLKIYEESGLRRINMAAVKTFLDTNPLTSIKESLTNYLDYYALVPDEDFKTSNVFYVAIQNSVSRSNSGLMTYPKFSLLIMGLEEITKDFAGKIPEEQRLRNLLKVISDETRFKILKFLSSRPATQKEIVEYTGLTKSTISYHISLLFKASLIDIDMFNNVASVRKETVKRLVKETRGLLKLGSHEDE